MNTASFTSHLIDPSARQDNRGVPIEESKVIQEDNSDDSFLSEGQATDHVVEQANFYHENA